MGRAWLAAYEALHGSWKEAGPLELCLNDLRVRNARTCKSFKPAVSKGCIPERCLVGKHINIMRVPLAVDATALRSRKHICKHNRCIAETAQYSCEMHSKC